VAEYYPQPAAGQRATAAFMRSMLPLTARKTADTSRAATTTATADPHLTFEVEANAVYVWDGWIKYFADPAADLLIDFTVPSGALGEWHMAAAGSGTAASGTTGYSLRMESNDVSQSRNAYGTSDADMGAIFHGTLRVGSTAGTFSLDWAQAASSAIAAVLYTDSWLRLRRIA
jgi:dihydrodipicolinate reductase